MSKYVAEQGYAGTAYPQSVIWHYRTDIDRDVLNRWFVNIFNQGVLSYIPSPDTAIAEPAIVGPTILAGTSFLIKQKDATSPNDKIAKVDMVLDYTLPVYSDGVGYALIAQWANDDDEYRGVEFSLKTPAEIILLNASGENYVRFSTVEIDSVAGGGTPGWVVSNVIDANTTWASMGSGLIGGSGFSGQMGYSGTSGFSGDPAALSGYSGESGYSGVKGDIGPGGGDSGFSGWSGWSGRSGWSGVSGYSSVFPGLSGTSGFSGSTGSECILVTCSDETTPLTTGWKTIFRMPYGMVLTSIKATLTTAETDPGAPTTQVKIRYAADYPGSIGSNVLSSYISITSGLKSITALPGTPTGISITTLPSDSEILVGVHQAGTISSGLKVYFIGNKL